MLWDIRGILMGINGTCGDENCDKCALTASKNGIARKIIGRYNKQYDT